MSLLFSSIRFPMHERKVAPRHSFSLHIYLTVLPYRTGYIRNLKAFFVCLFPREVNKVTNCAQHSEKQDFKRHLIRK